MAAAFLALRGLKKRFGDKQALAGIELEISAGELFVVLGPTGAGKTTLLRTIAGLEHADAGSIVMDGRALDSLSPAERDVALVFQNFSLYPDWSVRRNLEFPLRAPGRALAEPAIRERVQSAAATLRIESLLERPASKLSGGEMQRLAIGRAIVRQPRLYLMDEPLSNLDAKLRETLRVELAVLVRKLGVPMVYVTHDQGEALSMADRIGVLVDGRLEQVGSPREVYAQPNSELVARQLGQPSINVFSARRSAGRYLAQDGTPLCAAEAAGPELASIGVRPEHLFLSAGDPLASSAHVELIEQAGPHQVLVARWAGQRVHVLIDRDRAFTLGETLQLCIAPARAVVWARTERIS
jgi:multiple sugar transport system ATP-binding protein